MSTFQDISVKQNIYYALVRYICLKAGQSNGYRIIYYAVRDDAEVYLLTIYYKKDNNRIPTNQEIIELVETYCM